MINDNCRNKKEWWELYHSDDWESHDNTIFWPLFLLIFTIAMVAWGVLAHNQQDEKYQQHLAKHVGRETHFAPKCNWCKWDAEDKFLNGEIDDYKEN